MGARYVSDAEWDYEFRRQQALFDADTEFAFSMLDWAQDSITSAMKTGDATLVGEVCLAARKAVVTGWTNKELLLDVVTEDAEEAGRRVLLVASIERVAAIRAANEVTA